MTDSDAAFRPPSTTYDPPTIVDPRADLGATTATPEGDQSTTDVAKQQAGDVAQTAGDASQRVASVAKEQTQQVAAEAGQQAKQLLHQTQGELADQAGTQQQRLADRIRELGDELRSMADNSTQNGVATGVVRQAADRSHEVGSWLNDRDPAAVLDEIRSFARQRPVAFLALAVGAGVLAGRVTRGVKEQSSDDVAGPSDRSELMSTGPDYPLGATSDVPSAVGSGYATPSPYDRPANGPATSPVPTTGDFDRTGQPGQLA
jgi:hypothetical protein